MAKSRLGIIGRRRLPRGLALLSLTLGLLGCQVARQTARLPAEMVTAVLPSSRAKPVDPAALQTQVLRFADDFGSRHGGAADAYGRRIGTRKGIHEALGWKIGLNSAAVAIASSPNPTANLLDFVVLATVARGVLEHRAPGAEPPGAFDDWLRVGRELETNAWTLAEDTLTVDQAAELRQAISQVTSNTVAAGATFFSRPQELAAFLRHPSDRRVEPGSVFGLVGLDPTAGLDPAVREVTKTRLFAERALFAVERLPILLRWQTEWLSVQVLEGQPVADALASADRLSRAAESASRTAETLPDRVSAERRAIVEALEAQEGRLRALSAEVTRTLDAGEKMSTSLHGTIVVFDALMKRFGVGEPDPGPPDTNAPPFDILAYARTADRIEAMARQLDTVIRDAGATLDSPALDRRIADLNALATRLRTDAHSLVNHALLGLAALVLLVFACRVLYRRTGRASSGSPMAGDHR